jgi:glycosyltransferase 2 family protein
MNRKQQLAVLIGLIISAIFLWFAFRDLEPGKVLDVIRQANILLLLFGAAWYFVAVSIISLRWQFLLRAVKVVSLKNLIPLVCIGYMGNNVYPFRSGEALRIFLLKRDHDVPVVKATTTVIIERVFDGLVMLTFIIIPLLVTDIASDDIQRVVTLAAPIFLSALAVFFLLAAKPGIMRQLMEFAKRLSPGKLANIIDSIGEDIIAGLEGLRSPADLAGAIISSYTTWAVEASVYWIVMFAFDIHESYWVALMIVGTVNLAGLLPASPGMVGVFEFFAAAVLVAAGIDEVLAGGYAITVHIVIWLPVTLVGFFFLMRQGLGWSAITRARELEENTSHSEL